MNLGVQDLQMFRGICIIPPMEMDRNLGAHDLQTFRGTCIIPPMEVDRNNQNGKQQTWCQVIFGFFPPVLALSSLGFVTLIHTKSIWLLCVSCSQPYLANPQDPDVESGWKACLYHIFGPKMELFFKLDPSPFILHFFQKISQNAEVFSKCFETKILPRLPTMRHVCVQID